MNTPQWRVTDRAVLGLAARGKGARRKVDRRRADVETDELPVNGTVVVVLSVLGDEGRLLGRSVDQRCKSWRWSVGLHLPASASVLHDSQLLSVPLKAMISAR